MPHAIVVALGSGAASGIALAWALLPPAALSPVAGPLGWLALLGLAAVLTAVGDALRRRYRAEPPRPTPVEDGRDEMQRLLAALERLHQGRDPAGAAGEPGRRVAGE
jgi:hypothetical protein